MFDGPPQPALSSLERKNKWEQGQADYMGMDSFDNIQRKLDSFLKWTWGREMFFLNLLVILQIEKVWK